MPVGEDRDWTRTPEGTQGRKIDVSVVRSMSGTARDNTGENTDTGTHLVPDPSGDRTLVTELDGKNYTNYVTATDKRFQISKLNEVRNMNSLYIKTNES